MLMHIFERLKTMNNNNSQLDKIGYWVFAGVILVLFLILLLVLYLKLNQEKIDKCGCPEHGLKSHTILIVDKTDEISETQSKHLKSYLEKLKNDLEFHEKLTIYTLKPTSFYYLEPIFSMCKPQSGKEANVLIENRLMIQKRFEDFFSKPLENIEAELIKKSEFQQSPIIEMISEVGKLDDFSTDIDKRKLIIISDMLQNTETLSHYNKFTFEKFINSSAGKLLRPSLAGVEVEILYLQRPSAIQFQNENHIVFWNKYFASCGAQIVKITKIR